MKIRLPLLLAVACAATAAIAEPQVKLSPGTRGGILSTQVTTTPLDTDAQKHAGVLNATADVYAGTVDLSLRAGQRGTARSVHSVCFETLFTTEADYRFVLDVGGRQVVVSDHIVIPNDRRTCIQHELYQEVSFASPGIYSYHALTSATTQMAGEKHADHRGNIFVN